MKTSDQSDMKLGTIIVLYTMSKPNDFGFKSASVSVIVSNWLICILVCFNFSVLVCYGVSRNSCWTKATCVIN